METLIFQRIAHFFPSLKFKLKEAGILMKPEIFIKKTVISTLYLTFGFNIFLFFIFAKIGLWRVLLFTFPILLVLIFFYLMKLPDVMTRKKEKFIDKELVFAGRFLLVELESGVNLYNALVNISKNYKHVGKYFQEIIHNVDMGTTIEDALNDAIELSPSKDFRRITWQILNSIRTGGNIAKSLNATLEQINREQIIKVEEYSRKLNPMAMFYMIIAVILPSLGIALAIMFSVFIDIEISLTVLLLLAFLMGFVQYMFLSIIKFQRPAVEF